MEIIKSVEDSGLFLKGVSGIQNKAKEGSLGTLGAVLLGNILAGRAINRAGEGIIRAGYRSSI